jgi:class 3 adenylate cyclase
MSLQYRFNIRRKLSAAKYAFIALSVAFALDAISGAGASLIPQDRSFRQTGRLEWVADLGGLDPGRYYVSAGRTKGPCVLHKGDFEIASTRGTDQGLLKNLLLGSPIVVTGGEKQVLTISCDAQQGFAGGLADAPTMLPYRAGVLLELFRSLIYILVAPIASLFLLIDCICAFKEPVTHTRLTKQVLWSVVIFSLCAFFYTLSLGRLPRLLFDNQFSTILHIVLRSALSLSFLEIIFSFNKQWRWIRVSYYVVIAADIFVALLISPDSVILVKFYKLHYPYYALTTLFVHYDLISTASYSRAADWLQRVSATWGVTQLLDSVMNWLDSGTYKSPIVVILITVGIAIFRRREASLSLRIEQTVRRVLEAMSDNLPIEATLKSVATIIASETHFLRLSVYVDLYCIGRFERPHYALLRVASSGYGTNSNDFQDDEIVFSEGRGIMMKEAMSNGVYALKHGIDKGWYSNIPIGNLACINLSDDQERDLALVAESEQIIMRTMPAILMLEDKLLARSVRKSTLLNTLKSVKGYGQWQTHMGAIFADIEDFSKLVSHYKSLDEKSDSFGRFVTGTYFPALLKRLCGLAELESSEGDKIYVVVLSDLIPKGQSVESATVAAVRTLAHFVYVEGPELCRSAGFPAIKMRAGTYIGPATVVCDEFQVRTVGETINFAARLLDMAPKGAILVGDQFSDLFSRDEYVFGETREFLEKKDLIRAKPLFFRNPLKLIA